MDRKKIKINIANTDLIKDWTGFFIAGRLELTHMNYIYNYTMVPLLTELA